MDIKARFFNGASLEPVHITLQFNAGRLCLIDEGGAVLSAHPFEQIMMLYADRLGNRVDLGVDGLKDYRIMVESPSVRQKLSVYLPQVLVDPSGGGWAAGAKISAGLLCFLLLVGVFIWRVDRVLPSIIPDSYAREFGKSMADQYIMMTGGTCSEQQGVDALAALTSRLTEHYNLDQPLTVRVADSRLVNAFALPGGQIVVFRGLLTNAHSADEVAGVLAHEMGHVKRKHPMRGLSRALGLSDEISSS